jgi:hypothetical protein
MRYIKTFIFSPATYCQTIDQSIGSEITYLFGTSLELLMYCWFGNRITEAVRKSFGENQNSLVFLFRA